jgi:CelD/BcsL family acetyltransferase involved in cellulose biosynthesis
MTWTFEWRTAWTDVWDTEFEQRWRRLLEQAPRSRPFHRPEVVRAWAETCGRAAGITPLFGVATSADGHRILLTWVVVAYRGRRGTRRVLEPAGQAFFGYQSPLVVPVPGPGPQWASFWDAARDDLRGVCDAASFRFIDADQGVGRWSFEGGGASPVLHLSGVGTLADLLARRSANHRGDVGKKFRRAAERGAVGFGVFTPAETADAQRSFAREFVPAYGAVWDHRPSGNLLEVSPVRAFVTRLVDEGVGAGWTHFSRLTVGGEAVAWHLGLLHGGELYFWMPTHLVAWNAVSPGKLLLARLIEHGIAAGWSALHFQTGAQDYKRAWTDDDADLRAVRWRSPSLKGHVFGLYDRWRGSTPA